MLLKPRRRTRPIQKLHNRLHQLLRQSNLCVERTQGGPLRRLLLVMMVLAGAVAFSSCDDSSDVLAPYEGARPLDLLRVTQSYTPDVQWVGGRVAAVGVNRGQHAALDSTLVWLRARDENEIGSHVTVGSETSADLIRGFGGVPVDSLADGETYTFWLAERSAFAAALDSAQVDSFSFADTTMTMALVLRGRTGGDRDLDVEAEISRQETLLETRYVLSWTPENVTFRQVAIRDGRTGGFTDLIWHVVVPDDAAQGISSPVVIGEAPEFATEPVPFVGFGPSTYTLFMVTENWDGDFGLRAEGYVFYQILSTNFE